VECGVCLLSKVAILIRYGEKKKKRGKNLRNRIKETQWKATFKEAGYLTIV